MIAVARMRPASRARGGRSANRLSVPFDCRSSVTTAGALYPHEAGTSWAVARWRWAVRALECGGSTPLWGGRGEWVRTFFNRPPPRRRPRAARHSGMDCGRLRRLGGGDDDQGDEDGHHAEAEEVVDADGERERGLVGECVGATAEADGVRHYAHQGQADRDGGAEERERPGAQAH